MIEDMISGQYNNDVLSTTFGSRAYSLTETIATQNVNGIELPYIL